MHRVIETWFLIFRVECKMEGCTNAFRDRFIFVIEETMEISKMEGIKKKQTEAVQKLDGTIITNLKVTNSFLGLSILFRQVALQTEKGLAKITNQRMINERARLNKPPCRQTPSGSTPPPSATSTNPETQSWSDRASDDTAVRI